VLKKLGAGAVVSSIPVFIWWKWSIEQRKKRTEDVRTRVRVPNVQTIDDLMIERCRPGDVLLFDRRWEHCAAGPLAALVCVLGRTLLSFDDNSKSMAEGKFDHCGRFSRKISRLSFETQENTRSKADCCPLQNFIAFQALLSQVMSRI
jgi:hypothetical protein